MRKRFPSDAPAKRREDRQSRLAWHLCSDCPRPNPEWQDYRLCVRCRALRAAQKRRQYQRRKALCAA